jgi:hypothetical protein
VLIKRLLYGVDQVPDLAGKCVTGGRLNLRGALSPPIKLLTLSNGQSPAFQLRVTVGPSRTCVVEASPNLFSWSPVYTNTTSTNWDFDFTDGQCTNCPKRYYRAVSTP